MKQTAVDWLVENLNLYNDVYFITKTKRDIIKQAKQMEKEQIIDSFIEGEHQQGFEGEAEQYYKETFNIKEK